MSAVAGRKVVFKPGAPTGYVLAGYGRFVAGIEGRAVVTTQAPHEARRFEDKKDAESFARRYAIRGFDARACSARSENAS